MNYLRVKSYAKINLSLDILGVQDGYHLIDSVAPTIDICDIIAVKTRKDALVGITMHGLGSEAIPPESNNAVKAAEAFVSAYSTTGADITVWKNIPMGAGLGGSSADAAGVLNALASLYGIGDADGIKAIADSLGSDTGYMLTGGYARISGRGERVRPLDCDLKLDIGLLIPKTGVSTGACYALSDSIGEKVRTSDDVERALSEGDRLKLGKALSNGLYAPAKTLNADVGRAHEELEAFAPLGVSMTGSGSAVYAIFENDMFARYAQSRYGGKMRFIQTKTHLPPRKEK